MSRALAVRPYVNTNGTRIRCLYVPADMKQCPAWRELVQNPDEIVLGLYFDGVPVWRSPKKRGTYSLHFITMEILNLPFHLRADPRFVMVTDLIPGPKKPKNVRACFLPLVRELRKQRYEVLFSSADYIAQVELLQHQQLGYQGCVKCFHVSKFICTGCYDWGHQPGADPARLKTGADARRLGHDAVTHNFCNQGFHDQPCLVDVQTDCIRQSPEDALHLVEGCIKRHLFPILAGEKILTRPDNHGQGAAVWARWNQALKRFQMREELQRVLDQRWENFCKALRRSCKAKPFASGGSMTGEDWYHLIYDIVTQFATISFYL